MKANLRVSAVCVVWTLLLCCAPFSLMPMSVSAGQSGAPVATPTSLSLGCSTAEELAALIGEQPDGVITLTGDIVWDINTQVVARSPATVEMGEYSILIPAGQYMNLAGEIHFTGSGVDQPLFDLEENGELYASYDRFTITATGESGVAVHMGSGAKIAPVFELYATGAGGVALAADSDFEVRDAGMTVHATGKAGVAIDAAGDVSLQLGDVKGSIHAGGTVTLDATAADPIPEGARIIRRCAVLYNDRGEDMGRFGISMLAGDDLFLPDFMEIRLYDVEEAEKPIPLLIPARWEPTDFDVSLPGTYSLKCVPDYPITIDGLEPQEIAVHVLDPTLPHLTGYALYGGDVQINYAAWLDGAEEVRVLRAVDDGPLESLDASAWHSFDDGFVLPLESGHRYCFQAEITGGSRPGVTNVLEFYYSENPLDPGGDQDNGDRDDQGEEPPPPIIPPPPDPPPTDPPPIDPPPTDLPLTDPPPTDPPPAEPPTTPPGTPGTGGSPSRPDRDVGSDTAENTPSANSVTEVAPAAPEAREAALPPAENSVSITGAQVADQLAVNPERITILQNGMKVVIPAAALRSIGLADGETLTAFLDMPDTDVFTVRFRVGETELTGFDGEVFFADVPYVVPESGSDILCQKDGETFPSVGYASGKLEFELVTTGEYTILSPEAPAVVQTAALEPPAQDSPAEMEASAEVPASSSFPWAIPTVVLLIGGAACFGFFRWKGVKR